MPKSKLYIRTQDGKEVELLSGTYLYIRNAEINGVYWEWHKIPFLQAGIEKMIADAERFVEQIIIRLGEVDKDAFPHD